MNDILKYLVKDMTLTKSKFWESEDERRLVCRGINKPLYIPIDNALKTVYLGVASNRARDYTNSVFNTLNGRANLCLLVYQYNRFERWGIKVLSNGKIGTCDFADLNI